MRGPHLCRAQGNHRRSAGTDFGDRIFAKAAAVENSFVRAIGHGFGDKVLRALRHPLLTRTRSQRDDLSGRLVGRTDHGRDAPNQTNGVLVGFFDSDAALTHADFSLEARREVVLETLADHFGPLARQPLAYLDHDWTSTRWSKGCYGAFTPPGVLAGYGEWLRRPIGPLHWAGTETSPVWTGYIEGAIRSGERAAAEVLAATGPAKEPCALSTLEHEMRHHPASMFGNSIGIAPPQG